MEKICRKKIGWWANGIESTSIHREGWSCQRVDRTLRWAVLEVRHSGRRKGSVWSGEAERSSWERCTAGLGAEKMKGILWGADQWRKLEGKKDW